MSLIATIDMESNNMATEFPDFVTGTFAIVTSATVSPIPQGTYALQVPFQAGGVAQRLISSNTTLYMLMKLRVSVTANPTTQADYNLLAPKTSASATLAYLSIIVSSAGVITLRIVNNNPFAQIVSTTISNNTWYDVGFKLVSAASPNGIVELTVDGSVIGGSTTLNTVGTALDRIGVSAGGTMDSSTGFVYFDWILIDNAAYQVYSQPALTPNVNDAMGVGDQRYTQV